MKAAFIIALAVVSSSALADNYVNGYMRQDGTYVAPHYQTAPDNSRANNYSAQGNTNPYTGQAGTQNPYQQPHQQQQPSGYPHNGTSYGNQPMRKNW